LGLIEQAFQADKVDEFIMGDFEDVQVDLGLLERRKTPSRSFLPSSTNFGYSRQRSLESGQPPTRNSTKKEKAKRKQEKLSRKKNRKTEKVIDIP
jgi:hypothetical protein